MDEQGKAVRRQGEVFGLESVAKVEDVLRRHGRVFGNFSRTEPGGVRDKEGVDIEVDLTKFEKLANFDHFSIEVKSGPTGVLNFLAKTDLKIPGPRIKAIGLGPAVGEHLFVNKRLVVMAGDELLTDVRLMDQFHALYNYWLKRSNGENTEEMLKGLFFKFFGIEEEDLRKAARAIALKRSYRS